MRETCDSLGFGNRTALPPDTYLIIVDNGSTDKTLAIARDVQRWAPPGTVIIGSELERGYVPPRRTGVMLAHELTRRQGVDPATALILQADADTHYAEGYIEAMWAAAQAAGRNVVLEGDAEFPKVFRDEYPEYVALCARTDENVLAWLDTPEDVDVICTDHACGYLLSDYLAWGGHQREYREDGDEIHAETTRLYMRALSLGARKVRVPQAVAYHSERKIRLQTAEELATAGFPRENGWRQEWRQRYGGPSGVEGVITAQTHPDVLHAILLRQQHLLAMFGVLPLHVTRALGTSTSFHAQAEIQDIVTHLPKRNASDLRCRPGILLTDVLDLVGIPNGSLELALLTM